MNNRKTTRTDKTRAEWLEDESLELIRGWARDGLNYAEIAQKMRVGERTLYRWKKEEGQIRQALKEGRDVADRKVENALFESAIGGFIEEEETFMQEVNGVATKRVKRIKKYMQPNLGSIVFWLKNRKPDTWKDKREIITNDESLNKLDDLLNKLDEDIDE